MTVDGEQYWMYNTRNGVDRLSAAGGLVNRWMHLGGSPAFLRREVTAYADILCIRCTKEEDHGSLLAVIVQIGSELADTA